MQTQFHQYKIIKNLAEKYSHATYLAAPIGEPERRVVLLVFSSSLFSLPHERETVLEQAEALKALEHPYLVPILDLGIAEKRPFVVREYVPNPSLRSYLKQRAERLQLRDALAILLQVGEALAYVHNHKMVHGNIKPENILLDAQGRARLTDFAFLKRGNILARDQATQEYAFCYLAPEQLVSTWDASADQYAMGCLAYELLTGGLPFATEMFTSLSFSVQPAPLSERVPNLSPSLEVAVLKALAKDPSERFDDFSLFLECIRAAAPPSRVFPLSRPQAAGKQKPHPHLARSTKRPSVLTTSRKDGGPDHPLSEKLNVSSGAVDESVEEYNVKDLFADLQQEDGLEVRKLFSSEEDNVETAFAHDEMTEALPIDIDNTTGQTMQSSPHFPQRKRPQIKSRFMQMLLLTGTVLFIFGSLSCGLASVMGTQGQAQTSLVPTQQGLQSTVPSKTQRSTFTDQLIPTGILNLPPHFVSSTPRSSDSKQGINSSSTPNAFSTSTSSNSKTVANSPPTPATRLLPTATPTPSSLFGYWKFDEGSGSTAHDSSGDNYTATLQGNASWAKGKIGPYALSLNGSSNTYVDIPAPVVDTTKSYTFAAWVLLKDNSNGNSYTAVSIDGNQISGEYLGFSNYYFCLRTTSADSTSPSNWYTACTSYTPHINQWYHLAGIYDATAKTISLYVNGSLVQSTADPSAWKASGHTIIGRDKWSSNPIKFWPGLIDDVRIYQAALSASEIQALAQ